MLAAAVDAMEAAGIRVLHQSSLYETEPADAPQQDWFLNAVIHGETLLTPEQLLHELSSIEDKFGRRRDVFRGPRTLDLDILFYNSRIIHTKELQVPHPRLTERRFVLIPLVEVAPLLEHPVLHKTMRELLMETVDRSEVRLWRATP